jgi:putative transposase
MLRSYKLKIYANRDKLYGLDKLLDQYECDVNYFISIFWDTIDDIKGSYPSKDMMPHGKLSRLSAIKAWQVCKSARIQEEPVKPVFKGDEIDLDETQVVLNGFVSKEFDFWFKLSGITKGTRIPIPCKRYKHFTKALEKGKLRKSVKIKRHKDYYYLYVYVESEDKKCSNTNSIGVDVGLSNTIATSDGKFYGKSVQKVRSRTKHRKYEDGVSAQKQEINRVAKSLSKIYPNTDFVCEDLLFKGKKKRKKSFRRKYNTWAYKTLASRLDQLGCTEGFKVILVNPAYTSQRCPSCGWISEGNRKNLMFKCTKCNYTNNADTVGATNILNSYRQSTLVHGKL